MTDYTPTTQDVRNTWEHSLIEGTASDESKADADWDSDRMAAQFDRWLAERDRQIKAEAWQEGADAATSSFGVEWLVGPARNPYKSADV